MAENNRPDNLSSGRAHDDGADASRDESLERRRRDLDAKLASRRAQTAEAENAKSHGASGYGQAMKLSSEFIAGIVVGAGLGWMIDRLAGTSPWGLIVFLLLGFCAGVLNVLRSAGMIADPGPRAPDAPPPGKDRN